MIGRRCEKIWWFETDVLAIRSESGEGSDLGADDVKGAGDLGMKSALQGPCEVAAVEEVLTKGVKGLGTERTVGVTECRWERGKEQMVLEENGDGGVVEA